MHLSYNVPVFPMFPVFTTALTFDFLLSSFIVNISLGEKGGNNGNMKTIFVKGGLT